MGKTGVVHFTIGDQMGIRLMEIAQEHLIYNCDPVKALKALTDSLVGLPTDMALKILKGEMILGVDVEDQTMFVTKRIPEVHDGIYPKINPVDFMTRQSTEIHKHAESIKDSWYQLQRNMSTYGNRFQTDFDYQSIFRFIAGNNESILEELEDNTEVHMISGLITVTKQFILKTSSLFTVFKWMYNNWDEFGGNTGDLASLEPFYNYNEIKHQVSSDLIGVSLLMQQTMNLTYTPLKELTEIEEYFEAAREIEETISRGIEPVDINDNWSAGWLSPEGDYYALNGDIALMLHQQIGDALQEKGLIPEFGDDEEKINPDSWLEEHGWVKIHDDNIQFGGCLNMMAYRTPNLNMTEKQVDIIYRYGQVHKNGVLRMGWRLTPMSAAKFQMLARDNMPYVNKTYFEF